MTEETRRDGGAEDGRPPKVVIVGGGFAGFQAARSLAKRMGDEVDIVLVSPTNYFLYLPLLPEVAGGILEPRRISVALAAALPRCVRHAPGEVDELDLDGHDDRVARPRGRPPRDALRPPRHRRGQRAQGAADPRASPSTRRASAASPRPLPARPPDPPGRARGGVRRPRGARRPADTFVVVGGGLHGHGGHRPGLPVHPGARGQPRPRRGPTRWVLVSRGEILAGLDEATSRATADRVLRERGVDVRTHEEVDGGDRRRGASVVLRRAHPHPHAALVRRRAPRPADRRPRGARSSRAGWSSTTRLRVPGHPDVFACGDAAAVPDPSPSRRVHRDDRPARRAPGPPRRAQRRRLARARDGRGPTGTATSASSSTSAGLDAAANPLDVRLTGLPAHVVTRGYHLIAMPGNRVRTAVDWLLEALLPRQTAQLGLVRSPACRWTRRRRRCRSTGSASRTAPPRPGRWSRRTARFSRRRPSPAVRAGRPRPPRRGLGEGSVEGSSPATGAR